MSGLRPAPKRVTDGYKEPDLKDPASSVHAPRAPRAKKDTRRWCRGKPRIQHNPVVVLRPPYTGAPGYQCGIQPRYRRGQQMTYYWRCYHQRICGECGRVMDTSPTCPARPAGAPEQL